MNTYCGIIYTLEFSRGIKKFSGKRQPSPRRKTHKSKVLQLCSQHLLLSYARYRVKEATLIAAWLLTVKIPNLLPCLVLIVRMKSISPKREADDVISRTGCALLPFAGCDSSSLLAIFLQTGSQRKDRRGFHKQFTANCRKIGSRS